MPQINSKFENFVGRISKGFLGHKRCAVKNSANSEVIQ